MQTFLQIRLIQLLAVLCLLFVIPAHGGWTATGSMSFPNRTGHTSTLLKDGRVLVTGGRTSNSNWNALADAEIYNPNTNQWATMPPMSHKRFGHTANLLGNGCVLIIGGSYDNADATFSVELFDPSTEQWSTKPAIKQARSGHVVSWPQKSDHAAAKLSYGGWVRRIDGRSWIFCQGCSSSDGKEGCGCGQADISLPGFGAGSPKSCQSREDARFHAAFGVAGIA